MSNEIRGIDRTDLYLEKGVQKVMIVGDSGGSGGTGPKGDPGDSAYQVAVKNGFVGTEAQWLESLEGPPGPPGPGADLTEVNQKIEDVQSDIEAHVNQGINDAVHSLSTVNDITLYISTTGNDSNDGLTVGNPLKTIQAAINKLPKIINHSVVIQPAPGTYNETVTIRGFMGGGTISILGDTAVSDTYVLNSVAVNRTEVPVVIRGFNMQANNAHGIDIQYSKAVIIQFIKTIAIASSYNGLNSINSNVRIYGSIMSNKNAAIYAGVNSVINSEENTGVGNTYAIISVAGSSVGKLGTQPNGSESAVGATITPSNTNWIAGALLNSWNGSIRYFKNSVGTTYLELNAYGTTVAKDTIIATLPVGYRPTVTFALPLITDTAAIVSNGLYIDALGNVRLGSALAPGVYHSALYAFPA